MEVFDVDDMATQGSEAWAEEAMQQPAPEAAAAANSGGRLSVGGGGTAGGTPDIRTFFHAAAAGASAAPAAPAAASWEGAAVVAAAPADAQEWGPEGGDGSGGPAAASAAPSGGAGPRSSDAVLSAFKLARSAFQDVSDQYLVPASPLSGHCQADLVQEVFAGPATLGGPAEVVPLLVASAPLLPSGKAIVGQLPAEWLDFSGRSDALGTRCFFASRRHEHSVFEPLPPDRLLQVPLAASEWQPPLSVNADATLAAFARLAEEEPWLVQLHPGHRALRVLLRPGVLLLRMLRRGTALPAARFNWRVLNSAAANLANQSDGSARPVAATAVGEFSILSNVEDAAHTQPPHFVEWPLRREQLRSLGWMVSQERRRREPFVAEIRETSPCPDAPHWRLEGCLRCEYSGVKGGVLADAIGYGKTACTIGLIDYTLKDPLPQVPAAFSGFIPSRATLVLAPTNLHSQWLAEIKKFTGETMRVLSVPTCAQLKRLTLQDLAQADVVVATYRLFYSSPYLHRLQEVARTQKPDFAFPHSRTRATGEWATAYRRAFEALPGWASRLHDAIEQHPVTPAKGQSHHPILDDTTPAHEVEKAPSGGQARRRRGKSSATPSNKEVAEQQPLSRASEEIALTAASQLSSADSVAKRRRLTGKQASAMQPDSTQSEAVAGGSDHSTTYMPLEAFWWRRIVCDEFHELLSRYPPAQVAVELFHGDYKWGLSGTPPCQTLAKIRKAAGFLGVQLPTASAVEDGGEEPRKVAQEWLDAFVRRNTAELPPLEEEERIVPVHQSPKERALYLALTAQHGPTVRLGGSAEDVEMGGCPLEEPPEVQAARQSASGLLKLCSHFCASGATDVLTAEDECERQLVLRRERVRAVQREVKSLADRAATTARLVRHFEPHFGQAPRREDYSYICREPRAAVAARLRFLGASTTGTKADLLTRLLGPPTGRNSSAGPGAAAAAGEQAKAVALRADFDPSSAGRAADLAVDTSGAAAPLWAQLEGAAMAAAAAAGGVGSDAAAAAAGGAPSSARDLVLRGVGQALAAATPPATAPRAAPSRCARVRSGLGMPRWSGAASLSEDARAELEEANWEWLRDGDNAARLRKIVEAWKDDIQRTATEIQALEAAAAARLDSLHGFQQTLHASQVAAVSSGLHEETAATFAKYGSKIEALVKHVQRLQHQDPSCKIICFIQWEDLKRKIGLALEEFGVEHLSLQGSVWARRAALTRFQYEDGEGGGPRMLLLSLEESASGTNLTAANHVIIVHPMEAATREEAVAFEMQAVGRVRRPGQRRKIHIWRFVTVGTIEQQITEEHQKELWERQRAKISVSQPHPSCEDLESDAGERDEDLPMDDVNDAAGFDHYGADVSTQRYVTAAASSSTAAEALPPPAAAADDAADDDGETQPAADLADDTLAYDFGSGLGGGGGALFAAHPLDDAATQRY